MARGDPTQRDCRTVGFTSVLFPDVERVSADSDDLCDFDLRESNEVAEIQHAVAY